MVGAISYTGWRLVCVMPYEIFTNKMADVKQFVLLILLLMAMMLVFVNPHHFRADIAADYETGSLGA